MTRALSRAAVVAATAAILAAVALPGLAQTTVGPADRDVIWVRVADRSLPELLAVPEIAALAAAGGAAIAPASTLLGTTVDLGAVGAVLRERLAATEATDVLVIVVGVAPPAGDPLLPVVIAEGSPTTILRTEGAPRALTSDSTHREGVVTAGDVLATANAFWGGGVATTAVGAPVRPTDSPAPLDLHRRFLERSRSLVPVGGTFAILATLLGSGAILALALARRGRVPRRVLDALAWTVLAVPALSLVLLLVGHLPVLTTAVVLPTALAATALVTWIGGRRGASAAPTVLGAIVLLGFAVEAATGWRGQLLAFLGASLLDGGRFYGMSNAFIGLLVGAAAFVAWRIPRPRGVALLLATGAFAGLPMLGSNVGGATTAFAAAGLWWAIGRRGRLDPIALLLGAAVTIAGIAFVFAAHALWPTPTHVDGAIAEGGGIVGHYVDRLRIGARMLRDHPLSVVPALGGPILLALALRPPVGLAAGFADASGSREVVLVLAVSSLVAYVANDSGAAAAGLTWGLGLVLALWVSLRAASARMPA